MSFTALKGWNLHTQTFDTIEQLLDPRFNANYGLTRSCNLNQLYNGVAKVFDRQWLTTVMDVIDPHGEANHDQSYVRNLLNLLAGDERLHTLTLACMYIEHHEEYDDEEDHYNISETKFRVYSNLFSFHSYSWGHYHVNIDLDELTYQEAVNKIVEFFANKEGHFDPSQTSDYLLDPSQLPVATSQAQFIWGYHFGRLQYAMYYDFEGVLSRADRSVSLSSLAVEIRPEHRLVIDTVEYMTIKWVVPTQSGDRRMLHRQHSYSTKTNQLIAGVLRQTNELSDNLYGVELEVSTNCSVQQIVDAPEKTYCYVKQDSSISGSQRNMFEIVTVPATMKVHVKSLAQIYEKLGYTNFDVTKGTTNGMHIHIDMAAFHNANGTPDNIHLKNFCWFFLNPVNRKFHQEVSERDDATMLKYAHLPKYHHYTLPSLFRSTLDYAAHPFRGILHFKHDRDSSRCITLEVRMFKGIPSLANNIKNLEFVDSVFDFTRKACYQSNNLSNYLSYLDCTQSNRYSTLKEFISRIDSNDFKEAASLTGMMFGQTDPEKILTIVYKNAIDVTPSVLSTLNSLLNGVKFGLNKNGKLSVIESNRARLYDMDIALQQRLTRFKGGKIKHVSYPNS
jgi:hypothetical protein